MWNAVSDWLELFTLLSGLWAAYLWYEASNVKPKHIMEHWPVMPAGNLMINNSEGETIVWDIARAGKLNAMAARWTAASLVLGAAVTIMGKMTGTF